jgi:hypothetical protein
MGSKDSVLYYQKQPYDSRGAIQLIKFDLRNDSMEVIFDKSFHDFGLAKGDSVIVFTSAMAYGTSSPVNEVPIAYGQKAFSYNLHSKEFKRISEKLNYDNIVQFYVYPDLSLLFLSNLDMKESHFFGDKKRYVKYDLYSDTYEYFVKIRNDKKKLITQLSKFDRVFKGLTLDELMITDSEIIYRYNFSTKTGRNFFNYEKQKEIESEDSYQINNVRPIPGQNGYVLSVINAGTFDLIYVIIDRDGIILREFLPDMSEFRNKYLPEPELTEE